MASSYRSPKPSPTTVTTYRPYPSPKPSAPTVVSNSSAHPQGTTVNGIYRGVQVPGMTGKYQDDASITKARHANQDFWDKVNAQLAQKPPAAGSGGGGGGGLAASLGLSAATSPYDRALKQLGIDYGNNRNAALLQGQRMDADLNQLFSRLGNYEQERMDAGRRDYEGSGKSLARNYDTLLKRLEGDYSQGAGNTTKELERLGIQAVSPDALSSIGQDAMHQTSQAKIGKSYAIGNNNANADLFKSVMRELMGSAAAEGTSQRGKAKQSTADALTQLMQSFSKNKTDLAGQRADAALKARIANLRAASGGSGGSGGGKKASTKAAKGFDAAYNWLKQYAGGNTGKAADLAEEFRFLSTSPQGDDPNNPSGAKFGYSDPATLNHLYNQWAGAGGSGTKKGYTKNDAAAIQRAIALVFGKA